MIKNSAIFFCLVVLASCKSNVLQDYNEVEKVPADTLTIEKIKIETH
tara:strand:- start:492 stop:632 length:141 start_codon:yes stop_codon:yes gene_type:complete